MFKAPTLILIDILLLFIWLKQWCSCCS